MLVSGVSKSALDTSTCHCPWGRNIGIETNECTEQETKLDYTWVCRGVVKQGYHWWVPGIMCTDVCLDSSQWKQSSVCNGNDSSGHELCAHNTRLACVKTGHEVAVWLSVLGTRKACEGARHSARHAQAASMNSIGFEYRDSSCLWRLQYTHARP